MNAYTLTPDQQAASDRFFDFLMSDASQFMISGDAGAGKTYLMTHLVEEVMDNYENACKMLGTPVLYHSVAFTATTNKAAEVLEHSLKQPVQTIHSYLGLKVYDDYKSGKTKITTTPKTIVHRNLIIFIDEWSMIDSQLYKIILDCFQQCKIVYVGDHAQMAPVGETKSPLVDAMDPKNFVFLGKPIRNANTPALVSLCKQLRHTVETGTFAPIQADGPAVRYLTDREMQQKLDEKFTDLNPSCRVLCYTNDRVQEYNEYIREHVRNQPVQNQIGDVLVVAQTLSTRSATLNVERDVIIRNLDQYEDDPRFLGEFHDGKGIQYRVAQIQCLTGAQEQFHVRMPVHMSRVTEAKKYFAKKKDWHSYFDLKNSYADLREKAACTVYKSQGSTYDSVFVDLSNIGQSFDPQQVARMLFVAISRAKNNVYLYGSLPGRYQGARAA